MYTPELLSQPNARDVSTRARLARHVVVLARDDPAVVRSFNQTAARLRALERPERANVARKIFHSTAKTQKV